MNKPAVLFIIGILIGLLLAETTFGQTIQALLHSLFELLRQAIQGSGVDQPVT